MIFSSHRFGNLTRHADLILYVRKRGLKITMLIFARYMKDSVIVEAGTHNELLKRNGEYARIWNLQAQAFL
jgi:ABC-type multidrug transport system fused ATPase/permease subunit